MTTTTESAQASRAPMTRNALFIGGGLALAGVGLAAGLMLRSPEPTPTPQPVAQAPAEAAKAATAARKPAKPVESTAGSRSTPLDTQHAAANTCVGCGVVESVRAFERKGEASGVGAVAGGVVGAVVGNQVGGGNGRKAMTVIGAVGGGMAGHEIEKRAKSETLYEVKVRMDDGTLRSLTQKTAPAPGARVIVDGSSLRSAEGAGSSNEPKMMRASARGA